MYFYESISDPKSVVLESGQILVRNITNRLFRIGSNGVLTSRGGFAVVDSSDPIVKHNLALKRIVDMGPVNTEPQPSALKKSKKKKSEAELVSEEVSEEVPNHEESSNIATDVSTLEEVEDEVKVTPDVADTSL